MEKKDIVRYWRKRGGWGRAYWLDESNRKNQVRVKPVAPDDASAVWIDIDDVCCVEIDKDVSETEAQFIAKAVDSHKQLMKVSRDLVKILTVCLEEHREPTMHDLNDVDKLARIVLSKIKE